MQCNFVEQDRSIAMESLPLSKSRDEKQRTEDENVKEDLADHNLSLDEYSLIKILKYLDFDDLLAVEDASEELGRLAKKYCWPNFKFLRMGTSFLGGFQSLGLAPRKINLALERAIMLESIEFESVHGDIDILGPLGNLRQNIKTVKTNSYSERGFRIFSCKCRGIKEFVLHLKTEYVRQNQDVVLEQLFRNNPQLQVLGLHNTDLLSGKCFQKLLLCDLQELTMDIPARPINYFLFLTNFNRLLTYSCTLKSLVLRIPNADNEIFRLPMLRRGLLTELYITCRFYITQLDDILSEIFIVNKKIKIFKLNVSNMSDFKGSCFKSLNVDCIEDISISRHYANIDNHLFDALPLFKKLSSFKLDISSADYLYDVNRILRKSLINLNLKRLCLDFVTDIHESTFQAIGTLTGLENLEISGLAIDNISQNHLQHISETLRNLKYLKFSNFNAVTECALAELNKLSLLKELYLVGINVVGSAGLCELKQLQVLGCICCFAMDLSVLPEFVRLAKNLHTLEIHKRLIITTELLQAINEEISRRDGGQSLLLKTDLTQLQFRDIVNLSPLLRVTNV